MKEHKPTKTYANPQDGNTYYFAPSLEGEHDVLWACPTNVDGTSDFESAIPETDFSEPLSPEERARIVAAIAA